MVIISMMVLCNDIVGVEHDRRRSRLPNAPVEQRNLSLNIQHKPYTSYSRIHVPLLIDHLHNLYPLLPSPGSNSTLGNQTLSSQIAQYV